MFSGNKGFLGPINPASVLSTCAGKGNTFFSVVSYEKPTAFYINTLDRFTLIGSHQTMPKCVLGVSVHLVKTASANTNSLLRKIGEKPHYYPPPALYARGLNLISQEAIGVLNVRCSLPTLLNLPRVSLPNRNCRLRYYSKSNRHYPKNLAHSLKM